MDTIEARRRSAARRLLPGLAPVIALAAVATLAGRAVPVVGGPAFAILGGIGVSFFWPPSDRTRPGLAFASRSVLQAAIVVLGTGLSLRQVAVTGTASLPVLAGTLTVALLGAAVIGRFMGIPSDLRTLIGVGTGICGASAIAATDAVIAAPEADVSYAIATIFTFNVAAVLTFPTLGRLIGLSPHGFGLWAGTAVNDLSSVVAASTIFGHGATSYAVVVKLTRTLMIIPICIVLSAWRSHRLAQADGPRRGWAGQLRRAVPMFIAWFLVAVIANTAGLVPGSWHGSLTQAAQAMITAALAAIGLSTRAKDIRRAGLRPLALGALLWALVALSSLGLQVVV